MIPTEAYEKLMTMVIFENGKPYFCKDLNNGFKKGREAGHVGKHGYRKISVRIGEKKYSVLAHRVNWYNYFRSLPDQIDHIDNNKDNNSIMNLRIVTKSQNMLNRPKLNKKCSSNHIGVHFNKKHKVWKAQCQYQGKYVYFGSFKTEDEAVQARAKGVMDLGIDEYTYEKFTAAKAQGKI